MTKIGWDDSPWGYTYWDRIRDERRAEREGKTVEKKNKPTTEPKK